MAVSATWRNDLERWLEPFLAGLSHPARRRMCPLYIAGLIGPGDRKSVQPMATRAGDVGYDQLHHFVAAGAWDSAPLEAALLKEADRLVGDHAGFLVIDDTALPKKGQHSVGVGPQYASSLGKTSNCQSLVSTTLASREVPVMVGLRLFLPETWTEDAERMTRARVPKDRQVARTKPEIAIEEIDRVVASGIRFGCVLADAGYGSSGPFREALSERGLLWAVGLSRRQNVYPPDVALIFPVAKGGKRRQYQIPDCAPVSAAAMLEGETWQKTTWRRGTKGRLTCRFAARRVRIADGHKHRMLDNRMQCMPGDEVWLVGERRSTGEQKYYVSNLPIDTPLKKLAATIKARWVCEQAHQQLKEELGLDHFEGRSWIGLHRHALMTMIAYAFLQSRRLKAAGRKKKNRRPAAATQHAGNQASHTRPLRATSTLAMSSLREDHRGRRQHQSAKVVLSSERLHKRGPVLVYNREDDMHEMRRRIRGLCIHHGLGRFSHSLHAVSGVDGPRLVIVERKERGGPLRRAPGFDWLRAQIRERRPVLVILDPLISLSAGLEENSNDDMEALLAELRVLASTEETTILVVHHSGKNAEKTSGELSASRGASAIMGAVRGGVTLKAVQITDVLQDGPLKGLSSGRYVVAEGVKPNYGPKSDPVVYRLRQINVGNGTGKPMPASAELLLEDSDAAAFLARTGDDVVVHEIVDRRGSDAQAKAASIAAASSRQATIARLVDEQLGDRSKAPLEDERIGLAKRLQTARLVRGESRPVISNCVRSALGDDGVEIERGGRRVRICMAKDNTGHTSPWFLRRFDVDQTILSEHLQGLFE